MQSLDFGQLVGKTIVEAQQMQRIGYSDCGFLRLRFSDGTEYVIEAYYGAYDGNAIDEYPTRICVVCEDEDSPKLEPVK
jgi:hypothetical protein